MDSRTRAQARDDLKMLFGLPPYSGFDNICAGDGHFSNSLVRKYGMSIEELQKETGVR